VKTLREVYGQHRCDASKRITDARLNDDGSPVNDGLGPPNGAMIDTLEDVDTVVGWLAEFRRPHGFAISETQFVVFILNASRRLFSDRFFTSSFRPEFYTTLGVDWVMHNGPGPEQMEQGKINGHTQPVSPMKRVLLRTMPELAGELQGVVNVFDPWARDRGEYYSLDWKARAGAEQDEAFANKK
ncbi:MAG: peroxidase family protein, partial [Nitrospirota bacterium]|nr:peroxidase family protein [Nitrospirota bacterium]